jgi:hypothetical protein
VTFRPLASPDPLPDLLESGTFLVKAHVAQGDYEEEVEVECKSYGDGGLSFPILMPTSRLASQSRDLGSPRIPSVTPGVDEQRQSAEPRSRMKGEVADEALSGQYRMSPRRTRGCH